MRDPLDPERLHASHERSDDDPDTPTHLVGARPSDRARGDSLVGRTLNQYRITKKLGEGGMGVVYLADDTRLGRPVAVKALGARFTQDDDRRRRLRREARAAAALSHPAIATVYALEDVDDQLYIVSEYVAGRTLRQEVAAGPLPLPTLLSTAVQIARALAAAHAHGVVHRDLKPENVIRAGDGGVKVVDFGLAYIRTEPDRASGTRLTEPGSVLGTPGYMSPEQLRGDAIDFRTDLFSFGVLLYELATGAHPFASSNPASTLARVLEAHPPDITELCPSCPPELQPVVERCLQKDPTARFASTGELVQALERLRRDQAQATSRPGASGQKRLTRTPTRSSTSRLWWWQFHQIAVGLVYALTLIPMWVVRMQTPRPWGALLFFSTVATVGVAATVRFHLCFTSRFYRGELTAQRRQVDQLTRIADGLFVALLLAASATLGEAEVALTALLVGVAVASLVAFLVIEPATTRAAFTRARSKAPRRPRPTP